jgi:choline dehydrogenase-like flavoprotein
MECAGSKNLGKGQPMIIVVGSGPAAIAATHALVAQGHDVTILDVGTRLEPERQEIVERMSASDPSAWTEEDLAQIEGTRTADREAVHSKQSFGSSYGFASPSSAMNIKWRSQRGFSHSFALGGLSNVWGAVLLPYRQEDIAEWPVSLEDLVPHYQAVMDFIPGTAVVDGLEEILPSYSSQHNPLEPSRQATALLADLEKQKQALRNQGIHFGRSRLAINATGDQSRRACCYCALCLSGCPYGLIYSSAHTLDALLRTGKVTYRKDHLVEKVADSGNEVIVSGMDLLQDRPFQLKANRVFLGAGVLPTAKIILDSLAAFDKPIKLKDSQYFIYPMLRFKAVSDVELEKTHTSSQVFVEIDDPAISKHLIHLQIYGYSSFLIRELNRTFLRWPLMISFFRRHFLGRLLIVQGFIHSNESGEIELSLEKTVDGLSTLHARTKTSRHVLATILRVGWRLLRLAFRIRALPILPGLKVANPGSGYHSGGTFPMRENPSHRETDTLGRLPSMQRVHLVDASVFPSIPATSITFTVMANAHRIATAAGQLEKP